MRKPRTDLEMLDSVGSQVRDYSDPNVINCSSSRYSWNTYCCGPFRFIFLTGMLVWNLVLDVAGDSDNRHIQELLTRTDIVCTSLSLFTTLMGTVLIVYRILYVGRISGMGRYWGAVEIVVESAMLYTIALVFDMITLFTQVTYDGYALGVLTPITVRGLYSKISPLN